MYVFHILIIHRTPMYDATLFQKIYTFGDIYEYKRKTPDVDRRNCKITWHNTQDYFKL